MSFSVTPIIGKYAVWEKRNGRKRRVHLVNRDRMCETCDSDTCPAIQAVVGYLEAGGHRAPDGPPKLVALDPCPICGAVVKRDVVLDHATKGVGWKCSEGGYAHLFLHRYEHLEDWFTREGRERHHMFIKDIQPVVTEPEPPLVW